MAWALSNTYAAREVRFRHQVEVGLNAVNQLQISAIAAWRAHKRAEAEMLSDDDVLATAVMQWLQQRDSAHETLLRTRLRSLVERLQYNSAYLVDTHGRLLLDAHGPTDGRLPATESTALEQAFVQAGPAVVGLRQGDDSTFFSMLAPLFDAHGEAVAAIWLVMDAGTTLYPLLQGWPTTSHSGESLLLQQDERGLLYASPMRERADAPLTRYMGTSPSRDTIADRLTHGVRGVFYARDDQHHWVVATAGIVPDSHWLVVSKMDTAEAFAEVQQRNWQVLALAASLALLLSGSLVLLWLRHAWQRERTLKRDLQEHMMWLDAAQKAASVGYYVYDIQSQTYRGSTMAFEIFGLQPAPCATREQWLATVDPRDRDRVWEQNRQTILEHKPLRMQHRITRQNDGQLRWIEVLGDHSEDAETHQRRIVGTIQDITERKRTEEALDRYRSALEAQVRIDPLTQVANRLALDEALSQEWERAERSRAPLALLMIDIDLFKDYNDHHGHQQGDECLRHVALTLSSATGRAGDIVARYGGEEFAVLLPGATEEQAQAVGERLRLAVRDLQMKHSRGVDGGVVTISVGVASVQPHIIAEEDSSSAQPLQLAAELIRQADAALYAAKQRGRDQAQTWSAEMARFATLNQKA
ncbi:MAG: sensor domain-containing diguanylate cyclase [Comamonas sp.]